jgi:hypothetical protein
MMGISAKGGRDLWYYSHITFNALKGTVKEALHNCRPARDACGWTGWTIHYAY